MTIKCPVEFEAMFFVGKYLHGLSKAGDLYAFYVYAPVEGAYQNKHVIPCAPLWPDYARDMVLRYIPVPDDITVLGDYLKSKITSQDRSGNHIIGQDLIRPWRQSVFQGWPLYFMQDKPQTEHVTRPLHFWLAEVDLGTLLTYYGDTTDNGDSAPGPFIGP